MAENIIKYKGRFSSVEKQGIENFLDTLSGDLSNEKVSELLDEYCRNRNFIGSFSPENGDFFFIRDITDIIGYKGKFSDVERLNINKYLNTLSGDLNNDEITDLLKEYCRNRNFVGSFSPESGEFLFIRAS